ncbi:MAG: carboxypeptidase-like regulatory domain-containing protein [Candidatus Thermoplasmatota archaeon]|nr:carboxypeptidase-like regulatory domain-containing protein [Candidatus Thermoplasmatota archaeon]
MRLKNIIIYTTVLVLLVSTIPLSNEMVQANNHDFCQHTRSGVFQDAESAGITNDNCNNQEIGYAEEFDLDLGTLSGFVKDLQMNPIENATVRAYFHGTYEEAYSDKNGYYHVTNIPLCYCLKNCTCSEDGFYSEWVLLAIQENTQYNFTLRPLTPCYPCVDPPNPTGGNGWYITPVNLSFIYDPEVVAHIVFRIDDESWQEYIEAYLIKDTCVHKFEYYWVNFQGEQSAAVSVPLAIDLEPPVITKNIQRIGWREFSILFEVLYDNCSGVDFV